MDFCNPEASFFPSMWNLCDFAVAADEGGPSVHAGRKMEKAGEFCARGSELVYSCKYPAGVRTKYASRYVRVKRRLRSSIPTCTGTTEGSSLEG